MSEAIGIIVSNYVRLKDRIALQRMREHRNTLLQNYRIHAAQGFQGRDVWMRSMKPCRTFDYFLKRAVDGQDQDLEHGLVWILRERLSSFDDRLKVVPLAIVPGNGDWEVVTPRRHRSRMPHFAKHLRQVEKELRQIYKLAQD